MQQRIRVPQTSAVLRSNPADCHAVARALRADLFADSEQVSARLGPPPHGAVRRLDTFEVENVVCNARDDFTIVTSLSYEDCSSGIPLARYAASWNASVNPEQGVLDPPNELLDLHRVDTTDVGEATA